MWLAFARVYAGALWLAYGTSKLEPAWAAPGGEFFQAARYAAALISGPMHDFIISFVLPHQQIFAWLVACGETLVGFSLLLGLFKNVGAVGSMFLSATYYLAMGKYESRLGVESLEGLLFVFSLLLLVLPSTQHLSLDAQIVRHWRRRKGG
jgi:uncharacterized membrane protein YphA (DoxX/SURF4 family)